MAARDAMAMAQEAREKELQERLARMEALLARQSEQLQTIMTGLGIGQTEANIKTTDMPPADDKAPKTEVPADEPNSKPSDDPVPPKESAADEKPASDGKPAGKPKDK